MQQEIPKAYEPREVEQQWFARWIEMGCFRADVTSEKPPFSIVIPPPNVTGRLTLGHVLNNTLQDILCRHARMTGHETLWLPGTDHAGIATQTVVERKLRQMEGKTRRDLGREAFLEKVWAWKNEYGNIIVEQLKRLGCSCDWDRLRFTMDEDYSRSVQEVFVALYRKGLIHRGKRMVNWCPVSLTALSDEEVIMRPCNGTLYVMRYELVEHPGKFLQIATTRPETLMGDTAVAVHPEDSRYKQFIGAHVWRPFPRAAIPIIADAHIDMTFGTGVLKVTPAHDKADFEIGQRHGLPILDVLNPDGTLNELAGAEFVGMERFVARRHAAEKLAELGLLVREEPYQNNVGFSERANVPIEPRLSEQWFLRYPQVDRTLAAAREREIRFIPDRWLKTFEHWMENIQEWCISRQLWWGHRIPVWYHKHEPGRLHVSTEPPHDQENWEQDEDVLDTWFSSWLWPFATMDEPTRRKFYPTNVLVTGWDILFFWVARMMMAGYEFTGQRPFRDVYLTGLIRDEKGQKMSKSLGNSPDPVDLIEKYGADGLRFGLIRIMPYGQDIKFNEKQIEEGRNFANKIWNAARFRQIHGPCDAEPQLTANSNIGDVALDILSKLDYLISSVRAGYEEYKFGEVAHLLYDFFWGEYCDWFLEAAKPAIHSGDAQKKGEVLLVMDVVLHHFLRLLHPYMPHLTEELWQRLSFRAALQRKNINSISYTAFPESGILQRAGYDVGRINAARRNIADLQEAVRVTRNLRAEYNIPSNRKVEFILNADEDLPQDTLAVFCSLSGAEHLKRTKSPRLKKGTPSTLTPYGTVYLPLDGLVDVEAERTRLSKEIAKLESETAVSLAKLENRSFVERAPAHVVEEHRERVRQLGERVAKLRKMLDALPAS